MDYNSAEQLGPAGVRLRLLPAALGDGDMLASVYTAAEREQQQSRLGAILAAARVGELFFAVAQQEGCVVALVQLSRDGRAGERFRIRRFHTDRRWRNRGIGSSLLHFAVHAVFAQQGGKEIFSFILPENRASIAVHERAGFLEMAPPFPGPERHLCYVARRG